MAGIKFPIEAQLDASASDEVLAQLTQKFNALGHQIAQANKVKFQPVDKLSIDNIKHLEAGFQSLLKVSGELKRRLSATGQGGAGLFDVNWAKLYPDSNVQARQMRKAFEYVGGGDLFEPGPVAPSSSGGGSSRPPSPPSGGGGGRQPQGPVRRMASAGLGAAGLGSVADGFMGAGIAGGVGAIAAIGISKLIGGARAQVGHAEQEVIGYDTLKRTLGDVDVDFDTLRRSLRESARGLDMTFNESMRLGQQFTKLSGITGEAGAKAVGEEVYVAGGFGRSFGVDPSQSTSFFAQQRMYGTTKNVEDSRKLGLMIGEGIARSGAFAKVDEVLQVVGAYTEQQTRMGMNAANVGGYMGFLTSMMGSGIPGTDPMSSGLMLSRVNASIAGGGNAGEAGQNFLYRAIGSRLGLDPLQSIYMREQGAFGTGEQAFGDKSLYSQFSKMWGAGKAPGLASHSSATNLQLVMDQFAKNYKDRPELMISAMQSLFGGSMSQSMAMATAYKQYGSPALGGMASRLKRLGINVNDVSGTGTLRLAQIEAMKAPEAEKDRLAKEAATKNQEETDGTRTRAAINGVERAMQKAASELLVPLNAIREATMYMAGEKGGLGPRAIRAAVEKRDIDEQFRDRKADAVSSYQTAADAHTRAWNDYREHGAKMTPEQRAAAQAELARLLKAKSDAHEAIRGIDEMHRSALDSNEKMASAPDQRWQSATSRDDFLASAKAEGLSNEQARAMLAMFGQESSNGTDSKDSNAGAVGDMQIKPSTFAEFHAPGMDDIRNPEHNRRAAMRYFKELWAKAKGNARAAAAGYYGGPKAIGPNGTVREFHDKLNPNAPSTNEYGDQIVQRMRGIPETLLPGEGQREAAAKAQDIRVHVTGTAQVIDKDGKPMTAPVDMASSVSVPKPAGVQ